MHSTIAIEAFLKHMEPERQLDLPIAGMSCAACAARLEKVLNRLPSIPAAVNFAGERGRVELGPEAAGSWPTS